MLKNASPFRKFVVPGLSILIGGAYIVANWIHPNPEAHFIGFAILLGGVGIAIENYKRQRVCCSAAE